MNFNRKLIQLRIEKNLNQRQLANALDVTQSAVSLWERGERTPDIMSLFKICEYFDVSADYMIGLSEDESIRR